MSWAFLLSYACVCMSGRSKQFREFMYATCDQICNFIVIIIASLWNVFLPKFWMNHTWFSAKSKCVTLHITNRFASCQRANEKVYFYIISSRECFSFFLERIQQDLFHQHAKISFFHLSSLLPLHRIHAYGRFL